MDGMLLLGLAFGFGFGMAIAFLIARRIKEKAIDEIKRQFSVIPSKTVEDAQRKPSAGLKLDKEGIPGWVLWNAGVTRPCPWPSAPETNIEEKDDEQS